MSDNKGQDLLGTFKKLVSQRAPLERYWRDAFEYSYPIRGEGFSNFTGDGVQSATSAKAKQAKIYDSTATDSVRLLASSLLSGLTPANAQWFNLMIPNVADAMIPRSVRGWLQTSSDTMYAMIQSSNYNAQAFEFFIDIAIAGTCGLYIELDDNGLHFEHWPLASLYCQQSISKSGIDTVYRKLFMTANEAAQKFGLNSLPDDIKEELKNDPRSNKKYPFIHTIRPRLVDGKQSKGKLSKNLPFESVYICEKSHKVVFEGGYEEFPVIIPRWMVVPETDYAVGPLNDTLPDVKTLNKIVEMVLTNGEMAIAGTFVAQDDGVINPNTIRIGPRKIVFAADVNNIKPLTSGGNFNIAQAEITRLQAQIKRVMMSDELAPVERPQMTATEVQTRTMLIRQILGPTFARFQSEFLNALVGRCFSLAMRAGLLGQPPEELAQFSFVPEYKSPLQRAQRLDEVQAMDQFEANLGNLLQINPDIIDLYDIDKAVQKRAELLGIPVELMRETKEIQSIRQQKAQQAQQQQMMQMAQQAGLTQGQPPQQ